MRSSFPPAAAPRAGARDASRSELWDHPKGIAQSLRSAFSSPRQKIFYSMARRVRSTIGAKALLSGEEKTKLCAACLWDESNSFRHAVGEEARKGFRSEVNFSGIPRGIRQYVFYGEFDSGSERTLAACLRHASRTGNLNSLLIKFLVAHG